MSKPRAHIVGFDYFPEEYKGKVVISKDACREPTVAVIVNRATMIPLCKDCVKTIKEEIEKLEIEG